MGMPQHVNEQSFDGTVHRSMCIDGCLVDYVRHTSITSGFEIRDS